MGSDLPFLFSIAGLSGSVAGLAGLVAGIRRNSDLRPIDRFRLREIVEFAFANALLALSTLPLTDLLGGTEPAVRVVSAVAIVYVVTITGILYRRLRRTRIAVTTWARLAGLLDLLAIAVAAAAIVTARTSAFEFLLLLLLARPMMAFLFVLASFETDATATPGANAPDPA